MTKKDERESLNTRICACCGPDKPNGAVEKIPENPIMLGQAGYVCEKCRKTKRICRCGSGLPVIKDAKKPLPPYSYCRECYTGKYPATDYYMAGRSGETNG